MSIQIRVEAHECIASGACVIACPEVFAQDEEGIVVVKDENPPDELSAAVRDAEDACPAAVIEVEES